MKNKTKADDGTKRITFKTSKELHTALKIASTLRNMTMKMFIMNLVVEELERIGSIKIK